MPYVRFRLLNLAKSDHYQIRRHDDRRVYLNRAHQKGGWSFDLDLTLNRAVDLPSPEGTPFGVAVRPGRTARDSSLYLLPVFLALVLAPEEEVVLRARLGGAEGCDMFGEDPDLGATIDGHTAVWPIRRDGSQGNWGVGRTSLQPLIEKGYVALGRYDAKRGSWALWLLSRQAQDQIASGVLEVVSFDQERNVIDVRYSDVSDATFSRRYERMLVDVGASAAEFGQRPIASHWLAVDPVSVE